jgi:hypothetical protein
MGEGFLSDDYGEVETRFPVIQYHAHFELSSAFFTFRRISSGCETEKTEPPREK